MRWLAPAKINLHLRVGKRRDDGYHPLGSWLVTVGLFDRLILKREAFGFSFRCEDEMIPSDDRNLVMKAARAFASEIGTIREQLGCSVTLLKSIPHGSGLGGGSSDAATLLVALNSFLEAGWAVDRLSRVGAAIGSDVPFFFSAPSAVLAGRGEMVTSAPPPAVKWAVLVLPPMHVSTADCYRQFDAMGLGDDRDLTTVNFADWAKLSAGDLMARLVNDLEPPAFALQPNLAALKDRIERDTRRTIRMSGSGSSLFTLADEAAEAIEIAATIERNCGIRATAVQLAPDLRMSTDDRD